MASKKFWKRLLTDILGGFLIISAGLFGWVPGPGGIPLFLAGLSLLAINHEWARRWLEKAKAEGSKLFRKLFSEYPALMWLIDAIGVLCATVAYLLLKTYGGRLVDSATTALVFMSITLLLSNRQRLRRILNLFKH